MSLGPTTIAPVRSFGDIVCDYAIGRRPSRFLGLWGSVRTERAWLRASDSKDQELPQIFMTWFKNGPSPTRGAVARLLWYSAIGLVECEYPNNKPLPAFRAFSKPILSRSDLT
jgi:hypothetical protein